MPMEGKDIEALIREGFPKAKITITDLAGDGNHWAAEVIDDSFKGMNRVQQQRAVYASLKGKMDGAHGELHALALTTRQKIAFRPDLRLQALRQARADASLVRG